MKYNVMPNSEKWILKGIPFLFAAGSALHFTYEFTGSNIFVGLLSAVNESVWEHTKMILLPVIIWWLIYYVWKGKKYSIDRNRWWTSCLVSLLTGIIVIPISFYFYTQSFGTEIVWVDIMLLLLADISGQLMALHYYRHGKGHNYLLVSLVIILIISLYIFFTLYPPHIPMFLDLQTGKYGI